MANSSKELEQIYRLRYKVYCKECHFIEPNDCAKKGLEYDEYDEFSVHFLAESGKKIIGTARFVLDSPLGFPTEEYFELSALNINRRQTGEISRVVVAKPFRSIDHKIMLGIFRCVYQYWKQHNVKYALASMKLSILEFFQHVGFPFEVIKRYKLRTGSKHVEYLARYFFSEESIPTILSVKRMEADLKENHPHIYTLFTSSDSSRNKGFKKVKSNLLIPA